jgi:imidazoleglycerol phosphate dehydratase HisB
VLFLNFVGKYHKMVINKVIDFKEVVCTHFFSNLAYHTLLEVHFQQLSNGKWHVWIGKNCYIYYQSNF